MTSEQVKAIQSNMSRFMELAGESFYPSPDNQQKIYAQVRKMGISDAMMAEGGGEHLMSAAFVAIQSTLETAPPPPHRETPDERQARESAEFRRANLPRSHTEAPPKSIADNVRDYIKERDERIRADYESQKKAHEDARVRAEAESDLSGVPTFEDLKEGRGLSANGMRALSREQLTHYIKYSLTPYETWQMQEAQK